jgi:hypothetical protein
MAEVVRSVRKVREVGSARLTSIVICGNSTKIGRRHATLSTSGECWFHCIRVQTQAMAEIGVSRP